MMDSFLLSFCLLRSIAPENVPVQYGGFAQPNDTAFAGVKYSVEQLSIKAGEKESIEIALEQVLLQLLLLPLSSFLSHDYLASTIAASLVWGGFPQSSFY